MYSVQAVRCRLQTSGSWTMQTQYELHGPLTERALSALCCQAGEINMINYRRWVTSSVQHVGRLLRRVWNRPLLYSNYIGGHAPFITAQWMSCKARYCHRKLSLRPSVANVHASRPGLPVWKLHKLLPSRFPSSTSNPKPQHLRITAN